MKTIIISFLLLSSIVGFCQTKIYVKVSSMVDNEPLLFCDAKFFRIGKPPIEAHTGFEGIAEFNLSSNEAGVISVSYVGHKTFDTLVNPVEITDTIWVKLDTVTFDYRKIYNQEKAYSDLKSGVVNVLFVGHFWNDDEQKYNECCKKFGFNYVGTTDVVMNHLREAVENYNQVTLKYLDMVNDIGWRDELYEECGIKLK
jgi:hypothetical protein